MTSENEMSVLEGWASESLPGLVQVMLSGNPVSVQRSFVS